MFIDSAGGRDIAKKTLAPQTKITMQMISGITDQAISSQKPPWIRDPTSSGARRLNLMANTTIEPAIRMEKNAVMPIRKKYSASTRAAIVEAASGKRGVPDHIVYRFFSRRVLT